MHVFLSPLFPLNTISNDFFCPLRIKIGIRDPLHLPVGHLNNPSGQQTYSVSRLHFQTENLDLSPMQATSLKVHGARFFWKGNVGSPLELDDYLQELEKSENCRSEPRKELMADIQAARSLVAEAANAFEGIKDFEKKVIKIRNDLRLQAKDDYIEETLSLIHNLLVDLRAITLPKELTQESVQAYTQQVKDFCQKHIPLLEEPDHSKLSPENEKTKAQGEAILGAAGVDSGTPSAKNSEESPAPAKEEETTLPSTSTDCSKTEVGPEITQKAPTSTDTAEKTV